MSESRQYEFGKSRLVLTFGDMLTSTAEVLVSSDDYRLSMGGGVSSAILAAAGNSIALDAKKSGEREAGDVVVTSAGALSARYVFHVITIGPGGRAESDFNARELVKRATARCLELLQPLGVSSIAFPALGTGSAQFSMEDSAGAMAEIIAQYLSKLGARLDVSIYLYSRRNQAFDYVAFYEEFARRAPTVGSAPTAILREASTKSVVKSLALSLEAERQQLEQSLTELIEIGGNPQQVALIKGKLVDNLDKRLRAAQKDPSERKPIANVFISYAHADKEFHAELVKFLAPLKQKKFIKDWHDRLITPGASCESEIDKNIENADIVIFLISSNFMASDYIIGKEVKRAFERYRRGTAILIPVIIKPVLWDDSEFAGLQALPEDGRAITLWPDRDQAFVSVVKGIRKAVEEFRTPKDVEH